MKVSVDRLRWGLAGAVVVLLAGLFALVSYGRYAAAKKWKDILAKNGIHVTQESDNITWSQTVKGRTVFTIRAKKAIPLSQGKWTLRGVTLLLYGKSPESVDRVEGEEFEYDEKLGVAKAIGEVHMDIQAPNTLVHSRLPAAASSGAGRPEPEKDVIHVLTSGLVYLRKLGVAATDQRVEFRYAGLTCVSKGAEFDTSDNSLHLLADVEMNGEVHGSAAVLHAARADLDRDKNTIALLQPAVSSHGESGQAANALLLLRTDGSLEQADTTGGVMLETAGRRVSAQRLHALFGAQNTPETAVLSGGVTLDGSAAKPMHGTAAEADLAFTPAGAVKTVEAKGAVRLVSSLLRPGTRPLARELRGEQVTASFRPEGHGTRVNLQQVHAEGGASARGESFATVKPGTKVSPEAVSNGIVATQVSADDLLATFASTAGKNTGPALQHLTGQRHARLQQTGLNGAEEESSSDALELAFAPDRRLGVIADPGASTARDGQNAFRLQSAVQTGHVQIRDQAATQGGKRGALSLAHGDRAVFEASANRLTLNGGAAYQQGGTSLSANAVSVEQGSGNAEAQGNVEVTVASAGVAERDATHVLADRARLMRATQTAEFFGTNAHPARLWQAGSEVLAANLFLDDVHQSLSARPSANGGTVEAVFSGQRRKTDVKSSSPDRWGEKENAAGAGEAVHVSSAALNYSGERHEAVCSGGVQMRQGDMQARSQTAVVFLSGTAKPQAGAAKPVSASSNSLGGMSGAGELGGTLERMVLSGGVRLAAALGAGDGEQLVYTAKDDSYVLTGSAGKMPRMASTGQGMVTGPALLLRRGEKSIIVNGTDASNDHGVGGRVHTDVVVRPQKK